MMQEPIHRKSWTGNLMMVVSILVVCIGIPAAFVFSNSFSGWLKAAGIHENPNFAGGYLIADFNHFATQILEPLPDADSDFVARALAIRKFSVQKVAFRPLSGMGIAPRLNLTFEF